MKQNKTPKLFDPEVFLATLNELREELNGMLEKPITFTFALDYKAPKHEDKSTILSTFYDFNQKEGKVCIVVNSLLAVEYPLKKLKDGIIQGLVHAANPVGSYGRYSELRAILQILWTAKWGELPESIEDAPKGSPRAHLLKYDALMELGTEERAVARIRQRRDVGRKKYGTTMEREDIDELGWLIHAQEEAMDLVIYLERLRAEKLENQYKCDTAESTKEVDNSTIEVEWEKIDPSLN